MGRSSRKKVIPASSEGHVTYGDVLDDLGFSPKKAASLKLKADLHMEIMKRAEQYSQKQLQSILSESQSRVSQLLHGKISGFTLDMLVHYADSLGLHTEIRIKAARAQKRSPGKVTWASKKKARAAEARG
jgi:predicted XRE-type DNA-binding protein